MILKCYGFGFADFLSGNLYSRNLLKGRIYDHKEIYCLGLEWNDH